MLQETFNNFQSLSGFVPFGTSWPNLGVTETLTSEKERDAVGEGAILDKKQL